MSTSQEPPLDPWGLTVGEDLEDLTAVVPDQPYVPTGPQLGLPAQELLTTLAHRGRLGWWDTRRHRGARELVEAGIITSRGRLTDEGRALTAPLRRFAASVTVDARYSRHSSSLRVHCGDGTALVSAGPSSHELRGRDAEPTAEELAADHLGRATFEVVDNEAVTEVVARWMGLAPAWTFASYPEQLPAATLEARLVDDVAPPPDDADERLLRVWKEPWVVFTVQMEPGDYQSIYIHAGATGFHTCGGIAPGEAQFLPAPSSLVWEVLVERLGQALDHPG